VGVAQVAEPQDTVEAQPGDEAVCGGRVPVTSAAAVVGAATQAIVGGGSLDHEVLPGVPLMSQPKMWLLMILLARLACQGARLPPPKRPAMAVPVEPEVIMGHPMLMAPRDVSLDKAMGTAHWALTQAQNMLC
jgi:hypothetical protein